VLVFKDDEDYICLPWFWVPEVGATRKEREHGVAYLAWARQGFIRLTGGDVTDYDAVRADINKLVDDNKFGIEQLAVDRLFQGAQLCTQLQGDGMNVVAFGQGFLSMAAPSKSFEELVIAGRLLHGNNPVLDWMAKNVSVKTDPAGNMKPVKPKRHDKVKIDGIVATVMALGLMIAKEDTTSVYSDRGVVFV
jgi:phage terminase large subunit-like protein